MRIITGQNRAAAYLRRELTLQSCKLAAGKDCHFVGEMNIILKPQDWVET